MVIGAVDKLAVDALWPDLSAAGRSRAGIRALRSNSQETLAFSALTGVRSMNEVFPLERAAEAYERMMSGGARFRVVLTTGN